MSCCHVATVTRCDSRADFGACPYCGYSASGEPFDACPCCGYSATAGSLFGAVFPCCVFTQGNSRLSNKFSHVRRQLFEICAITENELLKACHFTKEFSR